MEDARQNNPYFIYLDNSDSVNNRIARMVASGLYEDSVMRPIDVTPDDIIITDKGKMIAGHTTAIIFGKSITSQEIIDRINNILGDDNVAVHAYNKRHIVMLSDRERAREQVLNMRRFLDDIETWSQSVVMLKEVFGDGNIADVDDDDAD